MEQKYNPPSAEDNTLTPAEKSKLRGQAQSLRPLIMIGKNGLTKQIIDELDTALLRDSLVKVRFNSERNHMHVYCREISAQTRSIYLGSVGRTATFYR